jgi:hypothetical protein
MSEPQQILNKKARVCSTNPLGEAGILQQFLNDLGPGHWLFAALVSKAWHQAYLQVPEHQMIGVSPTNARVPVRCVPHMTLYSAAVASTARLTLAREAGLELLTAQLQIAAGRWGNKATITVAAEAGRRWNLVIVGALQRRHVETLLWLVEELKCPLPEEALRIAAFGSCIDILAYLKQRGMTLTADLLRCAAYDGHWNALQYLHREGLEWSSEVCTTAARYGHLTLLQQLRENGCPWDPDQIADDAAFSGNVQMLQWLKEQGIVFTDVTMAVAASAGHIAVCEFLRFTEQRPWDTVVCMAAAKSNQLELLKWLRAHGCPCGDILVCKAAAYGGSLDVMIYMLEQLEQQHQLDAAMRTMLLTTMLAAAGTNNQLAAAQWLRQQGAGWPDVLQHTFGGEHEQWQKDVLEWARDEGCTSPLG